MSNNKEQPVQETIEDLTQQLEVNVDYLNSCIKYNEMCIFHNQIKIKTLQTKNAELAQQIQNIQITLDAYKNH